MLGWLGRRRNAIARWWWYVRWNMKNVTVSEMYGFVVADKLPPPWPGDVTKDVGNGVRMSIDADFRNWAK